MAAPTLDAVSALLGRLFDAMDWAEHDALAALFAPDARFTFAFTRADRQAGRLTAEVSGAEAIADFFRLSFASLAQTHHTLSNLYLEPDGSTASVHIRAYHQGKGAVADLFEESLGAARLGFVSGPDGALRIARFDYTVFIVLGSKGVFSEAGYEA